MRRTSFNDGWTVGPKANSFMEMIAGPGSEPALVTLPHDAMIGTERSPAGRAATAFYPGGSWEYKKSFEVPAEDEGKAIFVEFEGVYRDAQVRVNGTLIAHRPFGYSGFTAQMDHLLRVGEPNEVKVEARAHDDSRWYPGGGIYRSVWLHRGARVHLVPGGLQVATPEIDDDVAVLAVRAEVRNQSSGTSSAVLRVEVLDADAVIVASAEAPVTTAPGDVLTASQRLSVPGPRRWSPDDPSLYTCRATLLDGDEPLDEESTTFGIRSLTVDPLRGLRINGEPVLLRGACVHHDNGPLGAATIGRAEERRVELLKEAGFNAIRSAHNPLSRPMLEACDRLGVLVMDESFDMWTQPKSEHDYALRFPDWWEADVEAMVRKDFNHPSVVLYSIGNEIPEAGTPMGARTGRALAEKIRSLDSTRFVTEGISGLLVGGSELFAHLAESRQGAAAETPDAETGVNTAMTQIADLLNDLMTAPVVATNSAQTASYLDVVGYNYMESRLGTDGELYPHRVIVGSETHPAAIDRGWAAVRRHPHVIGDFTWTGWDYLGEAGIGRTAYSRPGDVPGPPSFLGEYPWRTAWCGDLDITGHRRPQSYYREIVFGLRADPYIAVQRPEHHGDVAAGTPWSWTDVVSTWSWPGHEGDPVTVEVYADADEVELVVNGRAVGRRPSGAAHRYRSAFETTYEPGLVEAVAFRAGDEIGRTAIRSAAGSVVLAATVDRADIAADPEDLAFVTLSLVDDDGVLHVSRDRAVEVLVEGAGVLQGLGSANPATEEAFTATSCTTFEGRALAVVRPTGPGRIVVTATAEGCEPRQVEIVSGPEPERERP
jgi:beta-galactosidase